MLDLKPFQETLGVGACAPATLKMLLTYFDLPGQELSDMELAKICGTNELGTTNKQMIETCEKFGLSCVEKYNANFEDIDEALKRGHPVVVDWFSPGRRDAPLGEMPDGHYSIAIGLDQENIHLQDPELGNMRTIPRKQFLRVWFDFNEPGHDYILDTKSVYLRYMIEVSKK